MNKVKTADNIRHFMNKKRRLNIATSQGFQMFALSIISSDSFIVFAFQLIGQGKSFFSDKACLVPAKVPFCISLPMTLWLEILWETGTA